MIGRTSVIVGLVAVMVLLLNGTSVPGWLAVAVTSSRQ